MSSVSESDSGLSQGGIGSGLHPDSDSSLSDCGQQHHSPHSYFHVSSVVPILL